MNDLTPPPDRPLDDAARARIRSQLIESTATRPARQRSAWLAPTVAAAAVVAIVGGGTWMLNRDGNTAAPLTPAGSGTSTVVTSPSPGPTDAHTESSPAPSTDALCQDAVNESLPGADTYRAQGGSRSDTYVWSLGDRWIVCDTFATLDGGVPTVFPVHEGTPVPTKDELLISMNFVELEGELQSQYVAAGIADPSVTKIAYAFPDGEVYEVVPDSQGVWFMDYQPSSGPLAGGGRLPSEPITVTVTAGGESSTYTLEWGQDTCAQVNHGC